MCEPESSETERGRHEHDLQIEPITCTAAQDALDYSDDEEYTAGASKNCNSGKATGIITQQDRASDAFQERVKIMFVLNIAFSVVGMAFPYANALLVISSVVVAFWIFSCKAKFAILGYVHFCELSNRFIVSIQILFLYLEFWLLALQHLTFLLCFGQ